MTIEVVDHDPAWGDRFAELRVAYERALAEVPVVAIEHVGSTSVPGLAAKPVIDVDVVVEPEHVDAASRALAAIGFEPVGDLGVPLRWAFRQPASIPFRTNTYVIVHGCLALRNHLGLRDVLRADPELRDRYAAVKRELAARHDDVEAYAEAKTPIIAEILGHAGLTIDEQDDIASVNRRRDRR